MLVTVTLAFKSGILLKSAFYEIHLARLAILMKRGDWVALVFPGEVCDWFLERVRDWLSVQGNCVFALQMQLLGVLSNSFQGGHGKALQCS